MPAVRNVGPAALHVPLLGRVFEPEETVDISDEDAALIAKNPDLEIVAAMPLADAEAEVAKAALDLSAAQAATTDDATKASTGQ